MLRVTTKYFHLCRGEELYTAVIKKPKVSTAEDEEESQTIPAHTVEAMYTDVNKIPTASTCNEEEPPPIPPYTVDQLCTNVNRTTTEGEIVCTNS